MKHTARILVGRKKFDLLVERKNQQLIVRMPDTGLPKELGSLRKGEISSEKSPEGDFIFTITLPAAPADTPDDRATRAVPLESLSKKKEKTLDDLNRILEEQVTNPEFTAGEFADRMMLGRTVFYRKVRDVTGHTPKRYLRAMRLKKAEELLSAGQHTVSEVAYLSGFNDPFYFSRCFKARFGVSPSHYRDRDGAFFAGDDL